MKSKFIINDNELNSDFINSLKSLFKDKMIQIYVKELEKASSETDYLLNNEENKKNLLEAVQRVQTGTGLITFTPEDWNEKYFKL